MLARAIKDRLRKGQVSLGTWMSMAHLSIAEILASAGYDWVVLETEHTAIDVSEALRIVAAIEGRGCVPLVRLAWNDPIQTKAVLDSGAAGVLVPMVNTRADAELAVASCKYPPLGRRGIGLARAQGYGSRFDEYVNAANDDTLLLVQIEHIEAVHNIDEILAVAGIDGTFIGPYDLSMSMGLPGQLDHPDVQAAQGKIVEATLAHGLAPGIHFVHPGRAAEQTAAAVAAGYQFIALGTDILFLGDACRNLREATDKLL
jgi:2-dehydro-3-deoxyglucarate aldolase